jgi:hypothetical protein
MTILIYWYMFQCNLQKINVILTLSRYYVWCYLKWDGLVQFGPEEYGISTLFIQLYTTQKKKKKIHEKLQYLTLSKRYLNIDYKPADYLIPLRYSDILHTPTLYKEWSLLKISWFLNQSYKLLIVLPI